MGNRDPRRVGNSRGLGMSVASIEAQDRPNRLDGGANVASATTTTNDVDEIRRSMAQIRQRLHQDMQGVVAGAEAASDWKHYVRLYPWAALAAAFGIGLVVVPRRRRSVTKTAQKAAEAAIAKVTGAAEEAEAKVESAVSSVKTAPPKEKKAGLFGVAFGMLFPLVLKVGQSYALSYVENWIAQQQAAAGGPGVNPPGAGAASPPPGAQRRPGA